MVKLNLMVTILLFMLGTQSSFAGITFFVDGESRNPDSAIVTCSGSYDFTITADPGYTPNYTFNSAPQRIYFFPQEDNTITIRNHCISTLNSRARIKCRQLAEFSSVVYTADPDHVSTATDWIVVAGLYWYEISFTLKLGSNVGDTGSCEINPRFGVYLNGEMQNTNSATVGPGSDILVPEGNIRRIDPPNN